MTSTIIKKGEKDSTAMWEEFLTPIIDAYHSLENHSEKNHDDSKQLLFEAVMATGKPHSFRCEFVFLRTRVRYFELIPSWELERIADDSEKYFSNIVAFRNELITGYGIEPKGRYSAKMLE